MRNDIKEAEFNELMPERLSVIAAEIRILSQTVFSGILEIGRRFAEAKSICPRGSWGEWVTDVTGYKQSMAENYIKVFKEYGGSQLNMAGDCADNEIYANLGITKLIELTAISPERRAEFVADNDVESKTVKELKALLKAEQDKQEQLQQAKDAALTKFSDAKMIADKLSAEIEMYQKQISDLEDRLADAEDEDGADEDAMAQMIADARAEERSAISKEIAHKNVLLDKAQAELERKNKELEQFKEKLLNAHKEKELVKNERDAAQSVLENEKKRVQELQAQLEAAASGADNGAEKAVDDTVIRLNVKFEDAQTAVSELMQLLADDSLSKYKELIVGTLKGLLDE